MELNSEQIIKALECCATRDCDNCPYIDNKEICFEISEAPTIIKELSEENEKIGIENFGLICELSRIKEDTVREFAERLKAKADIRKISTQHCEVVVNIDAIDQIADEMLEGK